MELDWCFPVIIVLICLFVVYKLLLKPATEKAERRERAAKQRRQAKLDFLTRGPDFKWSQRYIDRISKTGIAIDKHRAKVCVFGFGDDPHTWREIVRAEDILRVDIYENGESIQTTTPRHSVGNAIVGGLLLGGAGAVLGAMSSKSETTTEEKVRSLGLRLLVDDLEQPMYQVPFLSTTCSRDSERYQKAAQEVQHYYSLIEVLITRASRSDTTDSSVGGALGDDVKVVNGVDHSPETGTSRELGQNAEADADRHSGGSEIDALARTERPPVNEAVREIVISSLLQIKHHILADHAQLDETDCGATLSWDSTSISSTQSHSIEVVLVSADEVAINGERYPARRQDIRRGLADTYMRLLSSQAPKAT